MMISIDAALETDGLGLATELARQCHDLTKAKYGYYYYCHLTTEPYLYPMGGNVGFIDAEDYRLCCIWQDKRWVYDRGIYLRGLYKTGKLRDLYQLNFLSAEHLHYPIGLCSLKEWITTRHGGQLTELSDGFWLWRLSPEELPLVRQALLPSGIIICA